jgi:hypothetical protein
MKLKNMTGLTYRRKWAIEVIDLFAAIVAESVPITKQLFK